MDIYKPALVCDINVHNAIQTLGCNILLFEGVGCINWMNDNKKNLIQAYLLKVKKQLISKVLAKDGDYSQIAILNFGNGMYSNEVKEAMNEVFTVMFESPIKGGHGNRPCTLVILDLSKLREEAGICNEEPDEDEEEEEEKDEDF